MISLRFSCCFHLKKIDPVVKLKSPILYIAHTVQKREYSIYFILKTTVFQKPTISHITDTTSLIWSNPGLPRKYLVYVKKRKHFADTLGKIHSPGSQKGQIKVYLCAAAYHHLPIWDTILLSRCWIIHCLIFRSSFISFSSSSSSGISTQVGHLATKPLCLSVSTHSSSSTSFHVLSSVWHLS